MTLEDVDLKKTNLYFVIDMKSFFASVECAERGLDPMTTKLIVADETRTEKTVCLAVSPALRALGVKNRCRLFEIPKDVGDFIIAPPRMKKYIEYASEIYAIYLQYIDKSDIHVYSIDECFLDVTHYISIYKTTPREFARKLTTEIYDKLRIPSSCGIGTNLYLAKIALDITAKKSPDRIGFLDEEEYRKTLWHHKPLSDFWQISYGTIERLNRLGIEDMHGISTFNEDLLYKEFGINAELLIDHSYGKESCTMQDIKGYKSHSKSISSSQILPCAYTPEDAKIVLKEMVQNGCYELVKSNYSTPLLHIIIGYENHANPSSKATKRLSFPTNSYSIISKACLEMYNEIVPQNSLVRKITFDFGLLTPDDTEQYDLFTDISSLKKEKQIAGSVIKLKQKYGKNSILKGLDLNKQATQKERNLSIGGHKSGEK